MLKSLILFFLRKVKNLDSPSKIIEFCFKRHPEKVFLFQPDKTIQFSFKETEKRAKAIVTFLNEAGVRKQDTIAIFSSNSFEFFEIRIAAHLSGATLFLIPAGLDVETLEYFIKSSNTKLLFYQGITEIQRLKNNTKITQAIDLDSQQYSEIFKKNPTEIFPAARPDELATLNLSSATTGKVPKTVKLSNLNWSESLYNYIGVSDAKLPDKIIFLCPISLATAGSVPFLPLMFAGATNIILDGFSPQKVADYIKKYEVTRLYLPGGWLRVFFDWCKSQHVTFDSLDQIITGTEKIPAALLKKIIIYFGQIITVGYGMVEVLPPIAMLSVKDYSGWVNVRPEMLESCGKPIEGVKVKILDEQGNELAVSKVGRIAIKSRTVCLGYLDNPAENEKRFKDGWFYSDDYGYLDDKGYLYVMGRKEDIVFYGENPVFASQVEDMLYKVSFIKDCACVVKDSKLHVFMTPEIKFEEHEAENTVKAFCEKHLGSEAVPYKVHILDSLPVNNLGKLDRKLLKEKA